MNMVREMGSFDQEGAKIYSLLAEQHRHEKGPWTMILEKVVGHTNGISNQRVKILDLASGPGEPAATMARALPKAQVTATDISEDMVAKANKTAAALPNMTAMVADAQNLHDFGDNSFDVISCCYGFMFPPNKALALQETFRVLKPGGLLVATTWDHLDMLMLRSAIMESVLGFPPPPPEMDPMSLSQEGLFQQMVKDAGYLDIFQTTSTYPFNLGDDRELQFKMSTMLDSDKIDEHGDEGWARAKTGLESNITKYAQKAPGSAEMILPNNTFRLTTAKKPRSTK